MATDCDRCGAAMRATANTIRMPRRSDAIDRTERSLAGPALALGGAFCVPALLWLATLVLEWRDGGITRAAMENYALWSLALVALAVGGGALIGLAQRWPRIARRLARGRRLREMRDRAEALSIRASVELRDSEDPVRVIGRVVVANGALHVSDSSGAVRVPVDSRVRVFASDGERHVLTDGEDVEVVGIGRRALGAGDGYRDVEGEFVFDPRGCEVWVHELERLGAGVV